MNFLVEFLGDSPAIASLRDTVQRLLSGRVDGRRLPPVLVRGETGSGKGLLVRALLGASPRAQGPFVDVNCAAIPETMLEAELFGFERGAFTDAKHSKIGLFQAAHHGTIFLDEIGLLPRELQAKLLKVLEEKTVRRLGSLRSEPADPWVISATNENLQAAIREGRFREDLYHRLAVITLELPPLRERGHDILMLAEHFRARTAEDYGLGPSRLAPDACAALTAYRWPGNVRELGNIIERAVLLTDGSVIHRADLALPEAGAVSSVSAPVASLPPAVRSARQTNREQLEQALAETGRNISRTAARLGLTRNTVRARIKRFGLVGPGEGGSAQSPSLRSEPAIASAPGPPAPWQRRRVALLRVTRRSDHADAGEAQWTVPLKAMIEKVQRFGGKVEEISVDRLAASFGVDDIDEPARRAAHVALAIRREWKASGPAPEPPGPMVVHSCEVSVSDVGGRPEMDGKSRREVEPLMDRLAATAEPGTIVASADAVAFLRRRFFLVPLARSDAGTGSHQVEGHASFTLGPLAKGTRFVGRHEELALLANRLRSAQAGRGQVVAVVGEAGVGKSRLVWEFTRSPEAVATTRLETACADSDMAPYLPFIELLRRYFGIEADDVVAIVRERIEAVLSRHHEMPREARQSLRALLGVAEPEWEAKDPVERRREILNAVKGLLIAESRVRPVLIVFEDIHWADSESLALLDAVAALSSARILLVVTFRPTQRHRWNDLGNYTWMELAPLAGEFADELLADLLGPDASLDVLKRQLVEWTNGHPFFLEEWVQTLIETGVLTGERGAYRATRTATPGDVPATVEAVLATRIERLGHADRILLQSAAAIGAEVPVAVLSAVVDLDGDALRAAIGRLHAVELVHEGAADMRRGLAFKHALTREVAYRGVPSPERRDLHRKIVKALQAIPSAGGPDVIGRLGDHAVAGELWIEAVDYLRRAGDAAMAAAAVHEAEQYFTRALAALEHLPDTPETLKQRVDVRLRLQDALWPPLKFPELFKNLENAEAIAEKLGDATLQGWIACYLCRYFWATGDLANARIAGEHALAFARKTDNLALPAETNVYRGLVQEAAGDYREAVATLSRTNLNEAITFARTQFVSKRFAENGPVILRSFLVRALAQLGEFPAAIAEGDQATPQAEIRNNPFAEVAASGGLGAVYVMKGEPTRAIEILEPGLYKCREYGLSHWLPTLGGSLGAAYTRCGRIDEGLALLEEVVEHGARLGLQAHASVWEIFLGEAYLAAGRSGDASTVGRRVVTQCRQRGERGLEAWALHLLACIEATTGAGEAAHVQAGYEEAMALATARGMRPLVAHCQFGLGTYHARVGDHVKAEAYLSRAEDLFRALDMPRPGR